MPRIALTIGENQKRFGIDSDRILTRGSNFTRVQEKWQNCSIPGANTVNNLAIGLGDLYVTVYGGRTRKIGILLGRGMDIDEAKKTLEGVTLESLVVAERVARAVKAACLESSRKRFPLLLHVDDIISRKAKVNIPRKAFTFES